MMPSVAIDTKGNGLHLDGGVKHRVRLDVGGFARYHGPLQLRRIAPSSTFFGDNFRIGDCSTVARPVRRHDLLGGQRICRPGADSNDIWNTQVTSFSLPPAVDNNWYSVNVEAGNSLSCRPIPPPIRVASS